MKNKHSIVLQMFGILAGLVLVPAASVWAASYACWRGDRAYIQQDLTQARSWYEKSLAQNPQDTQALYCWAKVAYKQKEFVQAEQAFDKVLQETKLTPVQKEQALSSLADTAMQQENYQKAVNNYTQAVTLNPIDVGLKKKLAQARFLLAQQKQERERAQNEQDKGNSNNTADKNERQQNGQQDNTQDNQGKGAQKQSTGAEQSTDQPQQSPHDTQSATQESNRESKQQSRNQSDSTHKQEQDNTQNTNHSKFAQDNKQHIQPQQDKSQEKERQPAASQSQSQSQYKQKYSSKQQQASNAHNAQVPERYQRVVEAVAQEDQQALARLLAQAVYKEQKEQNYNQDYTHDKNW